MKKIISFLFVLLFIVFLASCQNTNDTDNISETKCKHSWESATCLDPRTCSKCGETRGEALGHTTTTEICSRCGKSFTSWEIKEFVDEFNQPTGQEFLNINSSGTFSNSATTNSKLNACVQVTSDSIAIMLFEYGNNLVKGTFDHNEYLITVLDQSGQKHYFEGAMVQGGTRIYLYSAYESEFLSLLKKSQKLSIYLEYSEYTTSTYLFEIKTNGFSNLYSRIK